MADPVLIGIIQNGNQRDFTLLLRRTSAEGLTEVYCEAASLGATAFKEQTYAEITRRMNNLPRTRKPRTLAHG